jgi:hypothetical protein
MLLLLLSFTKKVQKIGLMVNDSVCLEKLSPLLKPSAYSAKASVCFHYMLKPDYHFFGLDILS